ncbi:MAG: DUF4864 domain-containing protein [Pseudomonadota bacterium]
MSHAQTNDTLFPELAPDPVYQPQEVVGIQMRALGRNDSPYENAGIELTFRFASPANKINTGPLEKFATLFDLVDYAPMINHRSLEIGEPQLQNETAFVPVIIISGSDERIGYLFRLSKQSESPFEDAWMTDGVSRVNLPDATQAM